MSIVSSWVASHTGLPSFYLSGPGSLMAGDRLVARVSAGEERLVSDAGAPAGVPTVYTMGDDEVSLTRNGFDHMLLTDSAGRGVAMVRVIGDDSRSHSPGVSVFENQSGSPIVRYSAVAPTPGGTVECLTLLQDTKAIRALVKRRSPMWLVHNDQVCQLPGCDIEGARYVQALDFREARTGRRDRAERSWQIGYRELDPATASPAPVVTWGEWDAWGRSGVVNGALNPGFSQTDGMVEVARNKVVNPYPVAGPEVPHWGINFVADSVMSCTEGGVVRFDSIADRGGQGFRFLIGPSVGEMVSVSVDVRGTPQTLTDAGVYDTSYKSRQVTPVTINEDTWTRLDIPAREVITGGVNAYIYLRVRPGDWLELRRPVAQRVASAGQITSIPFFYGGYSPDPDLTPRWLGDPNPTESVLEGRAVVGYPGGYQHGSDALRVPPGTVVEVGALSDQTFLVTAVEPSTLIVNDVAQTVTGEVRLHEDALVALGPGTWTRIGVFEGNYDGPWTAGNPAGWQNWSAIEVCQRVAGMPEVV